MEIKPIKVSSETSNYAIVLAPGRKFPGTVVQGDSLMVLLSTAKEILEKARTLSDKELVSCAEALVESLSLRVEHYERVMQEHGLSLPYPKDNSK